MRSIKIFGVTLATVLLISGCNRKREPRSLQGELPRFSGPTPSIVTQQTVPLTAATVDQFVFWAERIPQSHVDLIKKQISAASNDSQVIKTLSEELLRTPIRDVDRHLMILAVIGETRNPAFITPLKRFIWSTEDLVPQAVGRGEAGTRLTFFNHSRALQARAAEMLAYIGTSDAFAATREVVKSHPAVEVRISAIDGYMFNHGDSSEAKTEVGQSASPGDAKMIGIPRKTRDMNAHEFDERLLAFYQRYPDERPPAPEMVPGITGRPKQTIPMKAIPVQGSR
jgi:hypothetical protein